MATSRKRPPLRGRRARLAEALGAGLPGPKAAAVAGYTSARAAEGVTAAEAKRDERVQDVIAEGQAKFRRAVAAACDTVLASFYPDEVEVPRGARNRKRKSPLTLKQATHQALKPAFLRAAGYAKIEVSGPGGGPIDAKVSFYIPDNGRGRP